MENQAFQGYYLDSVVSRITVGITNLDFSSNTWNDIKLEKHAFVSIRN